MRIILQMTENAHVNWPEYGDTIHDIGRFNKLSTARAALQEHRRQMHRDLGRNDCWNHNYRLIYTNGKEVR